MYVFVCVVVSAQDICDIIYNNIFCGKIAILNLMSRSSKLSSPGPHELWVYTQAFSYLYMMLNHGRDTPKFLE